MPGSVAVAADRLSVGARAGPADGRLAAEDVVPGHDDPGHDLHARANPLTS